MNIIRAPYTARMSYVLALLAAAVYVLRWTVSPDNYFFADDWMWFFYASKTPITAWLNVFPNHLYNDRPFGGLFIRALYNLFEFNHVAYHSVYLVLHLLNVVLAFFIATRLLHSDRAAFCSAILFGCWGSALNAPTWVASIFDLLCCTLILSALLAHLSARSSWLVAGLYLLAIRTKEIAIVLPFLLLADEIVSSLHWPKARIWKTAKALGPMLVVLLAYSLAYLRLSGRETIPESDPYHFAIGLPSFVSGMEYYLHDFLYIPNSGSAAVAVFLCLALLSLALRWRTEFLGFAGFVLFLLPVLFLPARRSTLYLYVPSAFFWIGLVALAQRIFRRAPRLLQIRWERALIAIAVAAIAWQYREIYNPITLSKLHSFAIFRSNIQQLRQFMPVPVPKTTLFIIGLPDYMNVFSYGPCFSVRLLYDEWSIDCVIEKSPEEIRRAFDAHLGPKILLTYKDGRLLK